MKSVHLFIAFAAMFAAGLTTLHPSSALGGSDIPAGYYQDQKVVYHNDGKGKDSSDYFKGLLKNIGNHIKAVGKDHIDLRVVDHGNGVMLFQEAQTNKALAKKLDFLRAQGVKFLICRNTLAERKIDWKQLYGVKEEDLVPSGVAEIIRLQQRSFLYIHP